MIRTTKKIKVLNIELDAALAFPVDFLLAQ